MTWLSGTECDTFPMEKQKSEVVNQVLRGLTLVSTRAGQAGEWTHALSFLPVTIPFYFQGYVKFQIFLLIFLAYFEPSQVNQYTLMTCSVLSAEHSAKGTKINSVHCSVVSDSLRPHGR